MPLFLITNDDGIDSPDLHRLAAAAAELGEVWVVAPAEQRSAASHSITLRAPVDVWPHDIPVPGIRSYACSGTPADCVRAGALYLLPRKPDTVLSGINYGYNSATDLQYSATAGAAFEGVFQGCRAIALSEHAGPCHEVTDAFLLPVLAELSELTPGPGQIFNVNFPGCPLSRCRGILRDRTVSAGTFYRDHYVLREALPGGRLRLEVEGVYNEDAEPGTDFRAIVENYVSVGVVNNLH